MRSIKAVVLFLLGGAYAAGAAFLGLLIGGGFGHGSSFYGRLPLVPVASAEWAFERGSLLPVAGIVLWGIAFASTAAASRRGRAVAVAWMLVHSLSAAFALRDIPEHPDKHLLLVLYAIGPVSLTVLIALRAISKSG